MDKEKQPKNFNWQVCGHQKITGFLQSAITNQKVFHAYLFVGPKGLGKNKVATEFITSLFCQNVEGQIPCETCFHCGQLKRGLHPDVYSVARETDEKTGKLKKDIAIDQIRDLKSRLQQATLLDSYKAAIITEAERLNESSANALLKLLEEPTAKTVIILMATSIGALPKTIASRCQVLNFLPVATREIEEYLKNAGAGEAAKNLSRLAFGRPGRALDFWQRSEANESREANVENFFQLAKVGPGARLALIEKMVDWSTDESQNLAVIRELINDWQALVRDLLLTRGENESFTANLKQLAMIKNQSADFSFARIKNILKNMGEAKEYMRHNLNSKNILENLIINL